MSNTATSTAQERVEPKGVITPRQLVWKQFKKNRLALIGMCVLIFFVLLAIFAPVLSTHERDAYDLTRAEEPPSSEHYMGTDEIGRDIYTRLLHGGRVSLSVGIVATGIQLVIGIILGSLAGYKGGTTDTIIMRLTDMFLAFPFLAMAITIAAVLGPSIYNTMIVIGILSWPRTCRIIRGEFLKIKNTDYVRAAKALGLRELKLVARHMIPNALPPLIVNATLSMATAVLVEAGLSFLGLGVVPPQPSWGNMLEIARNLRIVENFWWMYVPPGLMIFLTVLSINLVGDGLRDALDPRLKQ
ncbi:oligopeptide ABC transporter permease [Natranaerobius thermophilus]|uniref:Binding-protein-dependent transport systems inner membrane component n=1 Tax=Natranaerobius thermophilus (strain ATCC BAA-1301 / DSM 18059 / JW/NM-WN-LF) TaxID=457570 RepID=B2A2X6_NATTJ|nr:oligopeptide ABC transporter permease [Natranaerobius thermophilus]ACB86344.1 binding-protein-dependent transport systems inner membrane component [Natranaerobius thermophilus JW/NM-WN-LF]